MIYKYKTELGYMCFTNLSLSCETERRPAVWRHDRVGVEVPENFSGVEVPEIQRCGRRGASNTKVWT